MTEIYALSHPTTGEVRYIGKANCYKKRLASHIRDSRRRDTPLYRWIRKLSADGLIPKISVLIVCDGDWRKYEIDEIAKARNAGVRLLNVADGGDEPFCPRHVRVQNGRNNAAAIHAMHADPKKKAIWKGLKNLGLALKKGWVGESVKNKMLSRPDIFASLYHLL